LKRSWQSNGLTGFTRLCQASLDVVATPLNDTRLEFFAVLNSADNRAGGTQAQHNQHYSHHNFGSAHNCAPLQQFTGIRNLQGMDGHLGMTLF
jgi:hypothetical protein